MRFRQPRQRLAESAAAPTVDVEALRRRARELGPWYQNIELAPGVRTKNLEGDDDTIFHGHDIPGPLWRTIEPLLGPLDGQRVLDIGCNAGYMSFASKRLGAASVLGIDSNLGATTSFLDQATFCRDILGVDVAFREQSFFDPVPEGPFELVLFCGVLYHLEDYASALDRVAELVVPGHGRIVLETAVDHVTLTFPGAATYHGDSTTFFVPSSRVLLELLYERDFTVEAFRDLGTRAVAFLRPPAR